jgi:hypothetical protein
MCMEVRVIEPVIVPDVFASDLLKIEFLGPNVRFVLGVNHYEGSEVDHLVVAKVVMPIEAIPDAIKRVLAALATYEWNRIKPKLAS